MMRFWEDTLLNYLRLSNEDERVIKFVTKRILPLVEKLSGKIDWLEVGPGPGTKTMKILRGLESLVNSHFGIVQLLEPCRIWRDYLCESQPSLFTSIRSRRVVMSSSSFEDYTAKFSDISGVSEPNFITFFHVLYGHELIESTVKYLKRRVKSKSPVIVCIVVESEKSDFYRLRQKLASMGFEVPFSAAALIRHQLVKAGIPVTASNLNTKHCQVASCRGYMEWLLAFLLGCSQKALSKIPPNEKAEAYNLLSHYIHRKQNGYLTVPDLALISKIG